MQYLDITHKSAILDAAERGDWGTVEDLVSDGNRPYTPKEYLEHWKKTARCFAFATFDESWHEFDKEFAIIIRRMLEAELKGRSATQEG